MTETTTEPTTLTLMLQDRLRQNAQGGWSTNTIHRGTENYHGLHPRDLAIIQRAIEDDATRPLREEYDSLKAKANALCDAAKTLVNKSSNAKWISLNDWYAYRDAFRNAVEDYDAAEPREETHDGPSARRLDTADDRVPDSGDGVSGDDCGDGVSAVAAPIPDWKNWPLNEFTLREERRRRIVLTASEDAETYEPLDDENEVTAAPSPDRDECPGGDCGCQRLVRDLFPDAAPSPDCDGEPGEGVENDDDPDFGPSDDPSKTATLYDVMKAANIISATMSGATERYGKRLDAIERKMDDMRSRQSGTDSKVSGQGNAIAVLLDEKGVNPLTYRHDQLKKIWNYATKTRHDQNSLAQAVMPRLAEIESKLNFLHSDTDKRLLDVEAKVNAPLGEGGPTLPELAYQQDIDICKINHGEIETHRRLNRLERRHRKLRKQHRRDHTHIEAIFERLVAVEDAVDDDTDAAEGEPGERAQGVTFPVALEDVTPKHIAALVQQQDIPVRHPMNPNSWGLDDAMNQRIAEIESKLNFLHSDTDKRLLALEAEREPGAVPTVTDEMVDAFWAAYDHGMSTLSPKDSFRADVRVGLTEALKAGGGDVSNTPRPRWDLEPCEAIQAERQYQDAKYGGTTHDDTHSWAELALVLSAEYGEAIQSIKQMEWPGGAPKYYGDARSELIQVAAVCVALIERIDREAGGAK